MDLHVSEDAPRGAEQSVLVLRLPNEAIGPQEIVSVEPPVFAALS